MSESGRYQYVGKYSPEYLDIFDASFQRVVEKVGQKGFQFPQHADAEKALFSTLNAFDVALNPDIGNMSLDEIIRFVSNEGSGMPQNEMWTMIYRVALAEAAHTGEVSFDTLFDQTVDLTVGNGNNHGKGYHVHDRAYGPCNEENTNLEREAYRRMNS